MIDTTGFTVINGLAGNYLILDNFFILITKFGIPLIFVLILLTRNEKIITQTMLACILALAIDQMINFLVFRPRPFTVMKVKLLISHFANNSFPSTHTIMSFASAATLFFNSHKLGKHALFIAGFVGLSRVYIGVHYPTDVIAGIIIGLTSAFVVHKGFFYITKTF